jgi:hypothetical protein
MNDPIGTESTFMNGIEAFGWKAFPIGGLKYNYK